MSVSAKREAAHHAVEKGICSMRRACRYLELHRSSCQYRSKEAPEKTQHLVRRVIWLSRKYPRYGYRRIRALLAREGWKASRKFVQRIRRLEGLGVKGKRPRQRRQGASTALPTQARELNEVWSWDFVHDRTENGVALKMLTPIDEYSRQCLRIEVGRRLRSMEVLDALAEVMAKRGVPKYLRSDNGPEWERSGHRRPKVARRVSEANQFIAREVQDWLQELGIGTIYIEPGSPWQSQRSGDRRHEVPPEGCSQSIKTATWKASTTVSGTSA